MIKEYLKQQVNIELTDEMIAQLTMYCEFLQSENEKYNLTAITDVAEIWEKHFADSILGAAVIAQNANVCDVGSGAGFPSLPLKIARPDLRVTLVDSLEKRINFTQTLCGKLGIDASFFHDRAEDFAKTHSETYDVATARAVAALPILLEYVAQIVKIGGIVVAYKTDGTEMLSAQTASRILGLKFEKALNFTLESGGRRCLLVYRKVASTPAKYPRGQNKPRKQPL